MAFHIFVVDHEAHDNNQTHHDDHDDDDEITTMIIEYESLEAIRAMTSKWSP